MKIFLLYIVIICSALVIVYYLLYDITDYENMGLFQKQTTVSILKTFDEYLAKQPPDKKAIIAYDSLIQELSFYQRAFVNNIFSIPPDELGFKGPFYSLSSPGKLIKIQSVVIREGRETGVQYLPVHVYNDYIRMMKKMMNDLGRTLYVDSGYRSPGRQAYLFIYYLAKSSKFSLKENARWIAMPGYSEHGHPVNTAIDFCSEEGINGFSDDQTAEDFVKLPEYLWLVKNAADYNFYLSYPVNNKLGVAFEPWHWHWEKKTN
jgi:hypothetical protein